MEPSGFLESRTAPRSCEISTQLLPLLLTLDLRHRRGRGAVSIGCSFHDHLSAARRPFIAFTDSDCDSAMVRKSSALPVYFSTWR